MSLTLLAITKKKTRPGASFSNSDNYFVLRQLSLPVLRGRVFSFLRSTISPDHRPPGDIFQFFDFQFADVVVVHCCPLVCAPDAFVRALPAKPKRLRQPIARRPGTSIPADLSAPRAKRLAARPPLLSRHTRVANSTPPLITFRICDKPLCARETQSGRVIHRL